MRWKRTVLFIYKLFQLLSTQEKFFLFIGLIVAVSLLVGSTKLLVSHLFTTEPTVGGVFREGLYQPVNTLNPFFVNNPTEKALVNLMFDSLVRPDGRGSYELELAKNVWPFENGLTYQFELRDEARWSNGERLTSDDVIYSFSLARDFGSPETKNILKGWKIEKLDSQRFTITLPLRNNYFFQDLSFLKIVPKTKWSSITVEQWLQREDELLQVVSGPFVLDQRIKARNGTERLIFRPNQFAWQKPYINSVEFVIYADIQKAIDALKLRQVAAVGGLPADALASIINNRTKLETIKLPRIIAVFIQRSHMPSQLDLAKIKAQIQPREISEKIFLGYADATTDFFSESIKQILKLPLSTTSQAQAALFQQRRQPPTASSWLATTTPFELIVPRNYYFQKIGELFKTKFGWQLRVEETDRIQLDLIPTQSYQAILFGINYNLQPNLKPFFDPLSKFNLTGSNNVRLQQLLQDLEIGQLNQTGYLEHLALINQLLAETEPIIPLVNPYYLYVVPRRLGGYNALVLNQPEERFVKIEQWYLKTRFKW